MPCSKVVFTRYFISGPMSWSIFSVYYTRMDFEHPDVGTLRASLEDGLYRVALDVDPGITEVARALLPKSLRFNKPKFPAHISVVRDRELAPGMDVVLRRLDGERVAFTYDSFIYADETYFWLRAESPRLRAVRVELGLEPMGWVARPPDQSDWFHITLANLKP